MIKSELCMTRSDGVNLYRTYSDQNMKIERDGVMYDEAVDPEGFDRVYTETDIPIEVPEEEQADEPEEEPAEELVEEQD